MCTNNYYLIVLAIEINVFVLVCYLSYLSSVSLFSQGNTVGDLSSFIPVILLFTSLQPLPCVLLYCSLFLVLLQTCTSFFPAFQYLYLHFISLTKSTKHLCRDYQHFRPGTELHSFKTLHI